MGTFWGQLLLTLAFNVAVVVSVAVVMNLNRVRGFPVGYLYPLVMGLVAEWVTAGLGIALVVAAAVRETLLAHGLL